MGLNRLLLLIEDDITLSSILAEKLQLRGYQIEAVASGAAGLQSVQRQIPDLVILDLGLPDMSGFEVLAELRKSFSVPVMILSAEGTESGKVQALENGADDYVVKPFAEEELMARVTALLRRSDWRPQSGTILEIGQLQLDVTRRQAIIGEITLHLTPVEYAILFYLMERAGKVVTHQELLVNVWGPGYEGDYSVLRVNISRLRQKIEKAAPGMDYIQTVPRQGYMIPRQGQ